MVSEVKQERNPSVSKHRQFQAALEYGGGLPKSVLPSLLFGTSLSPFKLSRVENHLKIQNDKNS